MHLRLVSFVTCPFVQRAVIVLRHKAVEHETTYIDLANKPEWFLAISPRGKVPVLVAAGTPLFESQAICEFLEETHPSPPLMTSNPVERARDRAWFAFGAEDLFSVIHRMSLEPDEEAYRQSAATLESRLERLQKELGDRAWLSGSGARFGMADVALAPAWTRLSLYEREGRYRWPAGLDPLRAWTRRLQEVAAVRDSVPAAFEAQALGNMRKARAFLVS
jgi:glutathione S-transferase